MVSDTVCRKEYSHEIQSNAVDITDRIVIEVGLYVGHSFKEIASGLDRHPATIARKIKNNRTFIAGDFPFGNDCKYLKKCGERDLCDKITEDCSFNCVYYKHVKCYTVCLRYQSKVCSRLIRRLTSVMAVL